MGLLDGRRALIFGVANDHSIAWGIARALHEAGATVGFSSVESLIERRVRPLAESIGCHLRRALRHPVRRADQGRHGQVARRARRDRHPGPRHRVREARRPGRPVRRHLPRRVRDRARRLRLLARRADPRGPAVPPPRVKRPDAELLRRREGRHPLQRDGRGEGRARGVGPVSRRRPGPDGIRVNAISAGPIRTLSAGGISGFRKLYGPFNEIAPLRSHITIEDVGKSALYLVSDLSSAVTGEVVYVDGGFNILGVPTIE